MAVYIKLSHGRATPDEELHDWGTDGPVLGPFLFVHCVYASEVNVQTVKGTEMNWPLPEGLFLYGGVYYGDWTVIDDANLADSTVLMARLVNLDEQQPNELQQPKTEPDRINCSGCGIKIVDPPEDASPEELLCDKCCEIYTVRGIRII